MKNHTGAIHEWSKHLGPTHVNTDVGLVEQKETTTFQTSQKIVCILSPGNREEVQDCLRVANKFGIGLYPVSSGMNWGYGSNVPYASQCALLSLHRLNKILEYDEELAYARIEPGVTQRQLYDFLKSKGSHLWLDTTTADPESSLIANALDRGHGTTAYADHVSKIADLEVVLPSGQLLRTDFGRFQGSRTSSLDSFVSGPSFNGIFSQSNFGIVTQAAIWLMPKPEETLVGFLNIDSTNFLSKIIDIFRNYRIKNIIQAGPNFSNALRLLQAGTPYPWDLSHGVGPLSLEIVRDLQKKFGISTWNGSFALYGLREEVTARAQRIQTELQAQKIEVTWLDQKNYLEVKKQGSVLSLYEGYRHRIFAGMYGELPETLNKRPFWKKKLTGSQKQNHKGNPDLARCGFIWCPFVAPHRGADIADACQIIESTIREFGFDPDINLNCLRERVLHIYSSIVYDRDQPGEDERAMICQANLFERMAKNGFYSHRLGLHSTSQFTRSEESFQEFFEKIKSAIDPKNILAPGKYKP